MCKINLTSPQEEGMTPFDLIRQDDPKVSIRKDDESLILEKNG